MTATDATTLEPLETQCEWTRQSLGDSYIHQLSEREQAELDVALATAKARKDEVLDITAEDFPLPTLGPRLRGVADDLINGRGVALIRGLDRSRYSAEDASAIYWGVGAHLGRPWPQNAKGHLLGDVIDQGRTYDDPTSRGNELGRVGLPFHSDGSDLVGLFCLDAGADGGDSLVANVVSIHNELVRSEPELAAELYGDFTYDMRGEEGEGRKPWYRMPVFTRRGTRLFCRYIRPYIRSARRHADAPQPSARAKEAMDRVDALCAEPEHHVAMRLEPGDMQFINNYHVLHGRAPYQDDPEGGRVRHLKRLWLETDVLTDEDKPERYRLVGTSESWWDAAGRRARPRRG
jgi:alpha-ketoglutarate-dependent taurine dioxygenase